VHLTVNGHRVDAAPPGHVTLLDFLRDTLALTGTKRACDRGECGACTVLVDGRPVYGCLTLANACDGAAVRTVEGLGTPDRPHPLQRAFVEEDAAQCGFCTPGQLMAATALLERVADPSEAEIVAAMSGNLCRCGTYPKIVRAVRRAAEAGRDG
jgi:aerobic-type carbon monoxide dehydrogenase small subunit (CoxS/CutS family)